MKTLPRGADIPTLEPMVYPLAVVCPTCRVAEHHLCRTPSDAVRRVSHPRRYMAAAATDMVSALAPQVPPSQRWRLAQELVTAPDHTAPPEGSTIPYPDLDAALADLDTTARALEHLRSTTARAPAGVAAPELVRALNAARRRAQGLVEVLTTAARDQQILRHLGMGTTTAQINQELLMLRAQRVDAAVDSVAPPAPPAGSPVWQVAYQPSGRFRLRDLTTRAGGHREVGISLGFAPTPAAAARAAAQFLGPGRRVVLDPLRPSSSRPLADHGGRTLVDPQVVEDLLDGDEPAHTEFLAACAAVRRQLAGVADAGAWLAERADALQATHPQDRYPLACPLPLSVHHHDHADATIEATAWVPAHLIVATHHPVWGRLDSRPEVPARLLRDLVGTHDAAAFTFDLFTGEPVQLERITGWAGPVYQVTGDGNHRVHFLRTAGLPWAAAHLTYTPPPPVIDLYDLVNDDEDQDGRGEEGRYPPERVRHRRTLIGGLLDRGVIDAWWDEDRPELLWCRRLPAPWLLRSAAHATAANAVYEAAYPGALARLGVPDGVGTDPAAWRSWLTTPDSGRRPSGGTVAGR